MDSGVGMSDAGTIKPTDSVSQTGPAASSAPTKSGRGRPKRPVKAPLDKDTPPGAVQVPPGGQSKTGRSSHVQSATIPLTGWGEIDLHSFRKDIEPTFTVDARPYADLVDTVYQSLQSRYSTGGKHIPRSLFRYYCTIMWWYRVLWLHKSNGNVLTSEEKNFLNTLSSGEEFTLPSTIAQYLANLGNFLQGGEMYYFRKAPVNVGRVEGDPLVKTGWFETTDPGDRVNDAAFWLYAQLPSPAVALVDIVNEANQTSTAPVPAHTLSVIEPEIKDHIVYPTDNIIGWNNTPISPHHSSWRATFAQLGWAATRLAPDLQTDFGVSTSTLKWMSERLASLKDYKVASSRQIVLSTQGHPMLAYFLGTETPASQRDRFPPVAEAPANHLNGSRFSDLAVLSRYSIDAKVLAPAFSFGYRIERSLVMAQDSGGVVTWANFSHYQPWLIVKDDQSAYVPLTPAQLVGMNATFTYGSQPFLNVRRFATHELNRAVGLDAALVLSDTK
jgi:hypothetical protein